MNTFPHSVGEIMEWPIALKERATGRNISGMVTIRSFWEAITTTNGSMRNPTLKVREFFRNNPAADNKAKTSVKVDNLPVVYLSANWKDKRGRTTADNVLNNTGLLVLDFDKTDPIDTMIEVWTNMQECIFTSVSVSGNGAWACVCVDPMNWQGSIWSAFKRCDSLGLSCDKQCVDVTRARFAGHDDLAHLCRPFDYIPKMFKGAHDFDKAAMEVSVADDMLSGFRMAGDATPALVSTWIEEHFTNLSNAPEGLRDNTATSVLGHLKRLSDTYPYIDKGNILQRYIDTSVGAGHDLKKTKGRIKRLWK